jgi:hypothetical protein
MDRDMHARRVRLLDSDHAAVRQVVPWVMCLLLAAQGCQGTRLPNLVPSQYDSDKRSFNAHDPLPETGIGPDMGARPPGFMQERSEPRRTQESQQLLGVPAGGTNNAPPPGVPMGGSVVAPPGPIPGAPIGAPSQLYPDNVPR